MKNKTSFECIECGYQSPKYYGKCPQCNNWNSMIETKPAEIDSEPISSDVKILKLKDINKLEVSRNITGFDEFDRVLGGGIVPDSTILIGGEPGVGKSTLLLEVSGILAKKKKRVLYYSGEESASQIKIRAQRLNINSDDIFLLTMGTLEDLKKVILDIEPQYLILDSIQTIQSKRGGMITGSISSMKYVASEIIELAKKKHLTVFIIGHITKEGQIAGPKLLEHMVDAVLYFQGELKSDLRILRAEKNRFGPINELGIFQMSNEGLTSIKDPSQIFIQHRETSEPGIAIFPTMSGLRSILIEIQALVTESPFTGNPRRISVGFDNYRMSMLISVIEKKLKFPFYKSDVFLNITSGLSIRETAGDLAILGALISSYKNIPVPENVLIIGEVGLTGEIRAVSYIESRIKEAVRQGFTRFILPQAQSNISQFKDISLFSVRTVYEFFNHLKTLKNPDPR